MEPKDTIEELKRLALTFRDERNWEQFHDLKNLAMGLSIEAAELMELFLWKDKKEAADYVTSESGKRRLEEEMADVLVYLLYLSAASGIDLADATRRKIKLNAEKYPVGKCFNSNRKYTEL